MQHTRETIRRHNGPSGWILLILIAWIALGLLNPTDFKKTDKATVENVR